MEINIDNLSQSNDASSFPTVTPLLCGKEACHSEHNYGPATRGHWILHFVVSGKGYFSTSRGEYALQSDDLFIIRPYEVTRYTADSAEPWVYIWIGFSTTDTLLNRLLSRRDALHTPYLRELFSQAADKALDASDLRAYNFYLCGKIWELLGILIQKTEDDFSTAPKTHSVYIRPAIHMIETEYANGITVSDIASRLHVNRSSLYTIFKAETNKSPQEYLTEHRMKNALSLLTDHNCSVSVTALSVGYPDVFAFSRAFKRYYGCSPTAYKLCPLTAATEDENKL